HQSAAGDTDSLKQRFDDNEVGARAKLICPFRYRATKHNLSYPDSEFCKEGRQWPNISKLSSITREHLKKVHSSEYRCSDCNHKFSQVSIAELHDLKASHRQKCPRTGRTPLAGFDMTDEQWEKCRNWSQNQHVDRGSRNGLSERKPAWSWRRIYNSLFPTDRLDPYDKALYNDLPELPPGEPQKMSDFVSVFSRDFTPFVNSSNEEQSWPTELEETTTKRGPRIPGIYTPSSLEAQNSGQLQDNGQSIRCMVCKQKQDRDADTE
ncbi:unnamed protein product, partial [Clonostachys byssicola]